MSVMPGSALPVGPVVPAIATDSAAPAPYNAVLTKRHPEGFGLTLDLENVVTAVKTEEAKAQVAVGDRVLCFNAKPVSVDQLAKSFAADANEGETATFTMLRLGTPPTMGAGPSSALPTACGVGSPLVDGLPAAIDGLPPAELGTVLHVVPAPQSVPPSLPTIAPAPSQPPAQPAASDPDDLLAKRLEALKRA